MPATDRPTCGGCRFLEMKTRVGRTYRSCRDLGETETARICSAFLPATPGQPEIFIPNEFEIARQHQQRLRTPTRANVQNIVRDTLLRRYQYEREAYDGTNEALLRLQEINPEFDVDDIQGFQRDVARLIDLQTTRELALGLGSGAQLEEIERHRVESAFRRVPPVQSLPAPTVTVQAPQQPPALLERPKGQR